MARCHSRFHFLFPALDQMLTEPRFPQAAFPSPGRRTDPSQRWAREQALPAGTRPEYLLPQAHGEEDWNHTDLP